MTILESNGIIMVLNGIDVKLMSRNHLSTDSFGLSKILHLQAFHGVISQKNLTATCGALCANCAQSFKVNGGAAWSHSFWEKHGKTTTNLLGYNCGNLSDPPEYVG